MQSINPSDFDNQHQQKMDETLLVRFFIKPFKDGAESMKQGRPVFKDKEYVEIRIPGKRDAICRPASSVDIARFQKHYDAYKSRTTGELEEGTPLAEWPAISRSQVEELSFFNVRTVEQLVAMSDQNASRFQGIHSLQRNAKEWLEIAKEGAAAAELKSELEKRDDEIAELKAAVAALQAKPVKKKATRKKATRKKAAKKE